MDISTLLKFACEQDASDLHISAGETPILRVHGDMKHVSTDVLDAQETRKMIYDIMNDYQRKIFEEHNDVDFSIEFGEMARFRVNVFCQQRGLGAVFRKIPTKILTMEELGLPRIFSNVIRKERGLILVTGPTGSGKSTTLAAMLNQINEEREGHILTIEDPIEFVHQSKKCLVNQRELGAHTKSFSNALRAALREDPDYILIGELRDLETIQLALTAAETGHLVFGTLHTSSAPKTIDRIIDVFPAAQQGQVRSMFSESIQAVITQTLCKKIGGGRVPAFEILIGTTAVRNLIREGKIHQIPSTMQTSQNIGMQTLDMHLKALVEKGLIEQDIALEKSQNPQAILGGM